MASIAGSVFLDTREGKKISFGANRDTFLVIEKVDYKNTEFVVYTQTFVGHKENKCDWMKSKHVAKPVNPPNLSISEYSYKTIDTKGFFEKDPLIQIIIFYSKEAEEAESAKSKPPMTKPRKPEFATTDMALVIGFVTKSGMKRYYVVSEIYAKNYMVKMSSLRHIDESHLLDELCKENYKKNNVLTIKIDTKDNYHNVTVNKNEINAGNEKFQKYIHRPISDVNSHKKSAVDCDSKCVFTGFKPEEYTKLEEVDVYFHESDSNYRVPLLIEFKPKSGHQLGGIAKDKKVQYKIKRIEKDEKVNHKEWTKTYEKEESESDEVSNILIQIYNGYLGKEIKEIIKYIEKNTEDKDDESDCYKKEPVSKSVLTEALSWTFGSIGAIGTGVGGFLIYKYSALVITFFKSLF